MLIMRDGDEWMSMRISLGKKRDVVGLTLGMGQGKITCEEG